MKDKPKPQAVLIGHVDHGRTSLAAAMVKVLAVKGYEDGGKGDRERGGIMPKTPRSPARRNSFK